jgi:hypothetical protein
MIHIPSVEAMIRDEALRSAPPAAVPEFEFNFKKCPMARAVTGAARSSSTIAAQTFGAFAQSHFFEARSLQSDTFIRISRGFLADLEGDWFGVQIANSKGTGF